MPFPINVISNFSCGLFELYVVNREAYEQVYINLTHMVCKVFSFANKVV